MQLFFFAGQLFHGGDQPAQILQLAGNDNFGRLPIGHLAQCIQPLQCQHALAGVGFVHQLNAFGTGALHRENGLGLALCLTCLQ